MTERTARLDHLLREEISRIVARDVEDPRIGFATVTRVETAPDLRHAKVWVSIIGQPDERRATFRALARAMPYVRHELGSLRLRRIPELHLELDDSVERGTRVLQILDDLEAGREPSPPAPGETLPTPGVAHGEPEDQAVAEDGAPTGDGTDREAPTGGDGRGAAPGATRPGGRTAGQGGRGTAPGRGANRRRIVVRGEPGGRRGGGRTSTHRPDRGRP